MRNKFEVVKHIFLDTQAAVAGGMIGVGIATHESFTAAAGAVIGIFGAQTIHNIKIMREEPLDAKYDLGQNPRGKV